MSSKDTRYTKEGTYNRTISSIKLQSSTLGTETKWIFSYVYTCAPDVSFPIPNIRQLFVRMETKKPTIFGVVDLTQGYHQAPLTFATRSFTAFITFCVVYQFTRLLFELKQAPSYDGVYCINWINLPYM